MAKREFKDVDIVHKGDQILIPEGMELSKAVDWLLKKQQEQETVVKVVEEIKGYSYDCAHALGLAVKKIYGFTEKLSTPGSFFRPETPPTFINVPINAQGDTVEVFVGRFSMPGIEGAFSSAPTQNGINIIAKIKQKYRPKITHLATVTREILKEQSLYRGKAITVDFASDGKGGFDMVPPQFIPPYTGVNPRLNKTLMAAVEACIWTPIRYPKECKNAGVKTKRGALFAGPYGTGKSLVARKTADLCVEMGRTFLYCNNPDHLTRVFDFARVMNSPVCIFFEDFDVVVERNDTNQVQNMLDGVDTKNLDIILVLTTNHPEKIPPSLMRHGRIDAVISFVPPDAETAGLLVRDFAGSKLAIDADLAKIGQELEGMIPAVICGVVETATLHALRLTNGKDSSLTTEALLDSAAAIKDHIKMINAAIPRKISAIEQFGETIGGYMAYAMMQATEGSRWGHPGVNVVIKDHLKPSIKAVAERTLTAAAD